VLRLRIPVDTDRLVPSDTIRARPRRAVVLGNYPDRVRLVTEAWKPFGVEVSHIGGTRARFDVARALAGVDIVVAKSRAAVDAMSCGRAVYIHDTFGGDGWVTPEAYPAMEADHFAGQASGRVIGHDELVRDLGEYCAGMGMANRDLVLQHHDARAHAVDFASAAAEALARKREGAAVQPDDGDEAGVAALRRRVVVAEEKAAALRIQLDELGASRGMRVTVHYRRWRDRFMRRGR
jgi:hypothetical protein